jgi:protein-tyrosine-phosphatase
LRRQELRLKEGIMSDRAFQVLFLCTGNSARSILAESLLTHWSRGHFIAHSAGSQPKGTVHPYAIDLLRSLKMPSEGFRSKSWEEFAQADAPRLDFVFTVCDSAANEPCPVWPGQPMTAHWGVPDPAAVEGTELQKRQAFREAFRQLENRIKIFTALPVRMLDRVSLKREVDDIGKVTLSGDTIAA